MQEAKEPSSLLCAPNSRLKSRGCGASLLTQYISRYDARKTQKIRRLPKRLPSWKEDASVFVDVIFPAIGRHIQVLLFLADLAPYNFEMLRTAKGECQRFVVRHLASKRWQMGVNSIARELGVTRRFVKETLDLDYDKRRRKAEDEQERKRVLQFWAAHHARQVVEHFQLTPEEVFGK